MASVTDLDLLGAGGHATVIVNVAVRSGIPRVTVWYETRPDAVRFPAGTAFAPVTELPVMTPVVLGMGAIAARLEWRARFPLLGAALVDPSAVLGYGCMIGAGAVVMPGVVVNPNAEIAADVILNTGAIVEHDCQVGRNTHVSPGARLGGGVRIGANALIGTGAVVLPGVSVGDGAIVGAGGVVIDDVPAATTVVGIPARAVSP